jgi:hypothetical protein
VSAFVGDGVSVMDVAGACAVLWGETAGGAFATALAKSILIRSLQIGRMPPDPPYGLVDWKPGARVLLPSTCSPPSPRRGA